MKNKFTLLVVALLCFFVSVNAKNINVNFISNTSTSNLPNLSNEFYNVNYIQLPVTSVINNNENINLQLNGNTILSTTAKIKKMFADNYVARIKDANGITKATLKDLNFDGRYFKGLTSNGNTNACFSWFDGQFTFAWENAGVEYFIEPLSNYIAGSAKTDYVYFSKADIKPTNTNCGVTQIANNTNMPQGASLASSVDIDYAIMTDISMFAKYGSINAVINHTTAITNLVETDYTAADGFNNDMNYLIVENYVPVCSSCNPWASSVHITNNLDSITYTSTPIFLNTFDVASYYFNGSDTGLTVGLAWVGKVCSFFGKFNAIRDYSANMNNMRNLVSHELGHNFGAYHDAPGSGFIMAPAVNGSTVWSPASLSAMNTYITGTSCLSASAASTSLCDTIGSYITSIRNDSINQNLIIKWVPIAGAQYQIRFYDIAASTWSTYTLNPSTTDSMVWAYSFAGCSKNYILEIGAMCSTGTMFGATTQLVINVDKKIVPFDSIQSSTGSNVYCSNADIILNSTVIGGGTSPTYTWYKNGTLISGASASSYTATAGTVVTGDQFYSIITSNDPCANPINANSNIFTATIGNIVTPSVVIATTTNTICAGTSTTINAIPTNGGTSPIYQWKVNGTNAGTNSATFTTTTLANSDVVTCDMTSNSACLITATASSNAISMTVNASVLPTITISSVNATSCSSASNVTFTSLVTNAGTTPMYQWKVNGINNGVTTPTFSSTTLLNGDIVTCELTSNATCAVPAIVLSNAITRVILPTVVPTITITPDANPACSGTTVNFSALTTNEGTIPHYQWQINAINAGLDATTFSTNVLVNGDIITCVLKSNATCALPKSVTSNPINMTIITPVAAAISISVSPSNTVCAGNTITFTPSTINQGSAPTYTWFVNGVANGITTPTYTTNSLANGDIVTVNMISNSTCITTTNASSNPITMTINANQTPSITVASTKTTTCVGSSVTFTTTKTLSGTAPVYFWASNGVAIGTNSPTLTTSALPAGVNTITCTMLSNALVCLTTNTVVSNQYIINVDTLVEPIITITVDTNNICYGTNVKFTATVVNGGFFPSYKWKLNGGNVGGNFNTLYSFNLSNGDVMQCILTSSFTGCLSKQKDTSNAITMIVKPLVTPSVSISVDTNNVCKDSTMTFTAFNIVNGGTSPTYQWYINGLPSLGNTNSILVVDTLSNNNTVRCYIKSNADCPSPATVASNMIIAKVNPVVTPVAKLVASDTTICIGTNVKFFASGTGMGTSNIYQWYWNSLPVANTGFVYNNSLLETNDSVYIVMTTNAKCATKQFDTSDAVVMQVTDNITPAVYLSQSISSGAIGAAITYTAATPVIPPYTLQWFRNNVFATSTTNNIWTTTIQSSTDSVFAKVMNFTGCYKGTNATSATIHLIALSIGSLTPPNFAVYPNPTQSFATVEGAEAGDNIILYDITGKQLFTDIITSNNNYTLDLSNYASGFYQAKFIRGNAQWIVRLQKN